MSYVISFPAHHMHLISDICLSLALYDSNKKNNKMVQQSQQQLSDVAQMQRKRLQKVVDPIKYLLAVEHSSYPQHALTHFRQASSLVKKSVFESPQTLALIVSCVPLMFLTQSLVIPIVWFNGVMWYRNHTALKTSGYFEQQLPSSSDINNRRLVVLQAIMLQRSRTDSLQKLN